MNRSVLLLAASVVVGLTLGAVIPAAELLRGAALPCVFIQMFVSVGALAGDVQPTGSRWYVNTLIKHHALVSVPLLALGAIIGLDTWLGLGTFLLGAVPPANAIPSYVAVCGGDVRSAVRFTLLGYAVGLVATPILVLVVLGSSHSPWDLVVVVVVGLVAPSLLGTWCRPILSHIPRDVGVTILAVAAMVVMLGLGAELRRAVAAVTGQPWLAVAAVAIGLGRCAWGGLAGWWTSAEPSRRVDSALSMACKNAVLAALIASASMGSAAALPALLGLYGDSAVLVVAAWISGRKDRRVA